MAASEEVDSLLVLYPRVIWVAKTLSTTVKGIAFSILNALGAYHQNAKAQKLPSSKESITDRAGWGTTWFHLHPPGRQTHQPPIVACGKMLAGLDSPSEGTALGRVFKIGARTGATTGNFSNIKSQVKMAWDKEYNLPVSTEFCFIADPSTLARPFMCQGDSGSWVFTQEGKWAGTGFGGSVKAGVTTQAIGYVTDAQAILDWLKSINFEARLATF
ncbi:MAG: hypothetical protein LQ341_005606 [Variospora aurantia]|nr:MAG: hypothetical protein LQ341_005606 [Variospora aurantia]